MVRSMYSGVAGMKAQQSAMDVIGNNIANVRTYGFKSSRATFRDVYYQTLNGASAATSNRGGTNSTQIGYGAQLSSIDVMQGQSSFSMTGRSMDLAISGEGFLQVQDSEGNTFYTRAGQLVFDSAGNLVDSMGNFVLGVSGDPLGKNASSDKIQLSIPPVEPTISSVQETINNAKFTISSNKTNKDGNVTFAFVTDAELPGGMVSKAEITSGGSGITIKLNPDETFNSITDLNNAINDAITEANGGKEHPGGRFTMVVDPSSKFDGGLTGAEIVGKSFSAVPGKITGFPDTGVLGGLKFVDTSSDYTGSGDLTLNNSELEAGPPQRWRVSMTVGTSNYTGYINKDVGSGNFILKNDAGTDYITMSHNGYDALSSHWRSQDTANRPTTLEPTPGDTINADTPADPANPFTSRPATPSKELGLGSKGLKLTGGTQGGAQGLENLDSIIVGSDGIITAKHGVHGEISVGRIDLVTFANPQGLMQTGNTYFATTPNAGKLSYCKAGTDGSGALAAGSLEQSNVDLSQEFSDMITTQRAYQANSRLITVSDTMLEELVNLKR